jgi:methylmalonyl-CoA mutase C-terminal domain/subunit
MTTNRVIRVLIAKPGLDGHDVGAKLVCRALMQAGMEVIYTGLRFSARAIALTALQEDVDVIGLSILSGAHLQHVQALREQLLVAGIADKLLVVGGNIPKQDTEALCSMGVRRVFPTGTPFGDIVDFIRQEVQK